MKEFVLVMTVILGALPLYVVYYIGCMPGRVAAERKHPSAEAINVGSWATLLFGLVGWPWVLMWAYSHPAPEKEIEERQELADDASGDPS
jgi:hypothetical protein